MADYRDSVIKHEQTLMREMIQEAQDDGVDPVERAMAMHMEADTFLRSKGIVGQMVNDS